MHLFVKGLSGTLILSAKPTDTVARIKSIIEISEGVEAIKQRLSYGGQPLEDSETLESYGIENDSTIFVTLGLLGGAKKRKKKNYTTPKKNKHKKKKVKLAVLKFYKVDDNGKITRLRRECENKECGAGVFMANHADRHYCGRCGLTLVYNKPEDK
ncbi:ribosomal 40S subunit protein S27A [Dermatophagoides farinae]|uniref:Ribosomal 40S subunit protein S27A n=1 Tax=Dermatophagoides farinae TaxID=6954 RepID=A0A922HNA9_DERFA|nr:ubiquitin-40S ribosomal protein S27a-like [Dermatophagoides farinae]KAH7639994.1 ubiquitin-40s ribosomal protein s27a [Dermatophagoides farinae]KAH9493325.1 ribosomal 40S subunit protein S27A [Dermatophagoides farinae]